MVKSGTEENILNFSKSGCPDSNGVIIEPINNQLKFNGSLPNDSAWRIYLKVPFTPTSGETYTLSSKYHSGSFSKGCAVLDLRDSSMNKFPNEFKCDLGDSDRAVTKAVPSGVSYYTIHIWNDGGTTFNNYIVTPRIEKGSTQTDADTFAKDASWGSSMPTVVPPTRTGYTFVGYYDAPTDGIKYYNADGTSAKEFDKTENITLYAHWTINSYTVTFNDYDGSTIYSENFDYNTTPAFNGETPTRATDNNYKYTFSGWDRAFETVTAEATYTAQYTSTAHIYSYESVNETEHRKFCANCTHDLGTEAHEFEYRKINASTNAYVCAKCGYTEEIEATSYEITVPTGCEVTQALKSTLSNSYFVVTIEAPTERMSNNVKEYFVYWVDGDGNIVSTYYRYSFFAVKSASFTPVYATQDNYYTEKDKGLYASRVVDVRDNQDGKSYSIFVEHSVSKSTPVDENNKHLNGHGVIYTTATQMPTDFTLDNQDLIKKSATVSTSGTLTGMLEVTVEPGSEAGLWIRTYVTDINGEVHYSEPVYKPFANIETNSDDLQTLSTMSFDCTELNELENDAVNEPIEEPTENPTEEPTVGKLLSIWQIILMFIENIFSIFKGVSL